MVPIPQDTPPGKPLLDCRLNYVSTIKTHRKCIFNYVSPMTALLDLAIEYVSSIKSIQLSRSEIRSSTISLPVKAFHLRRIGVVSDTTIAN